MKKYFVLLSAMLVMAACAKGPQGNGTTVPEEESSAPVPVQLQANLPAVTPVTKSAIGALNHWHANQELYVYCIAREGLNSNASANAALDFRAILINNKLALFPGTFKLQKPDSTQLVNVYRENTEPYFYNEDRRYEFFAYYVDDAAGNEPTPQFDEDSISIKLNVTIDGSQDIMLAKTDKDADNVTDLNPNRLYSAYSARHGVTPNLVFKHLLSRFNVYVKSGDSSVTNDITITSFTIKSKTDGTIFIAYKDHPAEEDATHPNLTVSDANITYLPIWDGTNGNAEKRLLDGTLDVDGFTNTLTADQKYTSAITNDWPARTAPLGTVMVMPYEEEYEIKIGLKQQGYYDGTKETITTYTVKFVDLLSPDQDPKPQDPNNPRPGITERDRDTQALPGHQYDLNVVVYGLQAIQVTVSLQEWEDSGNFVVDQDEDQAIAINIAELDNSGKGTAANPLGLVAGGADYQITPTTDPVNQTLSYESSNPAVATVIVNENGVFIRPGDPGDAKIIITAAPTDKQPEGGYRVIRVRVTGSGPAPAPVPVVFTPVGVDFAGVEMTGNETKDIRTLFTLSDGYTGTLTYAITAGNDGNFFTLEGSNLTAGAADVSAHTVTVTVTAPADNGNNFSETTQAIVFNVAAN